MKRVLILGAAGRDFHNFNVVFRNNPEFEVIAFTATQIPDIAGRHYPPQLAGERYPMGIPIVEESKMEEVIRGRKGTIKFVKNGYQVIHDDPHGKAGLPPRIEREIPFAEMVKVDVPKNETETLWRNFLDCVRSRKDPIASVENGHRSASIGHLIIIALRTGRKLQWDPAKEVFTGDGASEANVHLARPQRAPYDYSFVG